MNHHRKIDILFRQDNFIFDNTPTNKRKLPLRIWSIKFYYLCKIDSVDEIIKIHYLIQTQGKFKKKGRQ